MTIKKEYEIDWTYTDSTTNKRMKEQEEISLETLLNMMKEKDKEIEQLKRDFEIVDQECSRLEKKEVKQEKIIELLVNKLNQNYNKVFESSEVKEIIEIYEKIKNISNLSGIKLRKECIKQYFEKKATNDG